MLIHIDGFDSYSTSSDLLFQYTSSSLPTIGTTSGRFNQGGLSTTNYANYLSKSFSQNLTEIWTGAAFKFNTVYGTTPLICIVGGSGIEALLNFNANSNAFAAFKGHYASQIGSSGTRSISTGGWHFLEFHYKMDTAVGIVELYIDNELVFSNTGQNTTQYSSTSFPTIWLAGDNSNTAYITWDDWYILDPTHGAFNTTRIGDSRIQTLRPSSDAGPNNGTPSTGTDHYAMVNAPQNDGGSTYITLTGTSGQEELFGMTSLPVTPTTIYGAKVLNYAKKTDAGSLNSNSIISSNSVVANSNIHSLTTSYSGIAGYFEFDPSTGVAWSPAGINSASCGFKIS